MHPDLLQGLNEAHIQDLHRGVARYRFTHPRNSIPRPRERTTRYSATPSKRPRECGTHA